MGRQVLKGARAKEVIVPLLVKEPLPEGELVDENRARVARLIGFKVINSVFALSDTDGPEIPAQPTAGWNYAQALTKLGIREVQFDTISGNLQGWSRGTEIAINPVAVRPAKTRFHEIGHVVLGHTLPHSLEDYATHRGLKELQAESVAYLAMHELNLLDEEAASASRGYIQHWLDNETPPDKAIQQVFSATDRILRAGR